MGVHELSRKKIIARLLQEGWFHVGGAKHEKYAHSDIEGVIVIPRHVTISIGVSQSIYKTAKWSKK